MKAFCPMLAILAAMIFAGGIARADQSQIPAAYRNVGVDEHLNLQLPLDTRLYDENGQYTTLAAMLHPDRPILLQLGYLDCPMLCDAISHSLVDATKNLELTVGKDFDFVFVSIDPHETVSDAHRAWADDRARYPTVGSADGWHFLSGTSESVAAVERAQREVPPAWEGRQGPQ